MQLTFLILTRDSLYNISRDHQTQLAFLPGMIRYQDIIDKESFDKILLEYFSKFSRYKTILLLSNDVVLQKSIAITPQTNIENEVQKFIDIIPFTEANIAKKIVQKNNAVNIYATNSAIFKVVVKVALQNDWQIAHVVPLAPFLHILQNQTFAYNDLKKIVKEKKILKDLDFQEQDEVIVNTKKKLIQIFYTTHYDSSVSRVNNFCSNTVYA